MKAKHTPAPWKITASRVDAYTYYLGAYEGDLNMNQREANAALIAAAPDLLSEMRHTARNLQSRVDYFPSDRAHSEDIEYKILTAWLERTLAVIAKAEGVQ